MPRKPTLEYPGGVYHLIQRGNNKEFIFKNNEDKEYLISLLKEYKEVMEFEIYGYVIMGNHYHFIIKIGLVPLKNIMQRINNKFSRYYNRKYERTGHVFENRYKGILVIDDRYLLSLLRYVHQNPVAAKICKKVDEYKWSSDFNYRYNKIEDMVNINMILDIFSNNRQLAIRAYKDFMDENIKEDIEAFEKVDIIGKVNTNTIEDYIKKDKKTLDEILEEITEDTKIFNEIKKGSRKRYLSKYKKRFVEESIKLNYTMDEIGKTISISDAAVFKIVNKSGGKN